MRLAPLALAAVLVLGVNACSSAEQTSTDRDESAAQSQILQPGRPGQANQTLDPDTTLDVAPWNDADADFMQMMVPHHAQALEMAGLAPTRARSAGVLGLARRVEGAQGPEIRSMASWLAAREIPVPDSMAGTGSDSGSATGHDGHSTLMPGMLTEGQLAELEAARGARFDRLFLAGMVQHHQGAVDMAGDELEEGSDQLALELAADIATGQLAEIRRMRDLRRAL